MSSDSHGEHKEPNYIGVFIILTVFTIAEVGVVKLGWSREMLIAALVALALTKAIMVAAYFMHLKFEKKALAMIAGIPLVLCTYLLFMLMPDAK